MMELTSLLRHTLLVSSIGVLAACSSADSTSTTPNTPNTPTAVTINGSIFASSVNGASVTVKNTSGASIAGPVTTANDGTYSIDILDIDLANDLVFESTGGVFTDEATTTPDVAAGAMSAYVAGGTLATGDSVHVTPGTTITAMLITQHGKAASGAQLAFFSAFAYNPDISVQPVDITDPASLTADDDAKHIGWRAAVFSKLAQDLTLQPAEQFDMFAALAQDLSNGDLDGVDANGAIDIGTTGKQLPSDILDKYITATEAFNTAEAANLVVTYNPPADNEHGKNQFTLEITDTGGAPVTGLTDLQVMPKMYMADRTHATPTGEIVETNPGVSGIYNITVYYLMPSRMMDDTTMGTWDLKASTGNKSVHFYPNIKMAKMDNTVKTDPPLKGITDTIINMDGLEVGRPYNLFRDADPDPVGVSTYDFNIFIAAMENMMSFPALVVGETLESGMGGTPLTVDTVDIDVKVNDGNWQSNKDIPLGNGVWSLNALPLDNPGTNTINVRLIVNGETKTTDGKDAVADDNDFVTFTVTLP